MAAGSGVGARCVSCIAPTNIAVIKYWGKRDVVANLEQLARERPWDFQPLASAGRLLLESGQNKAGLMMLRRARERALRASDRDGVGRLMRRAGG